MFNDGYHTPTTRFPGVLAAQICPYCNKTPELVKGLEIYGPGKSYSRDDFYLCRPCKAWVGCHRGTTRSLGRLADSKLRYFKNRTHRIFDTLWIGANDRQGERVRAYTWLAEQLGIEPRFCHIGMFDVETCEKVIKICQDH